MVLGLCFPKGMKLSELEDLNYFGHSDSDSSFDSDSLLGADTDEDGNMGVNLKFHVSNTFLCLHAFGNLGGG